MSSISVEHGSYKLACNVYVFKIILCNWTALRQPSRPYSQASSLNLPHLDQWIGLCEYDILLYLLDVVCSIGFLCDRELALESIL